MMKLEILDTAIQLLFGLSIRQVLVYSLFEGIHAHAHVCILSHLCLNCMRRHLLSLLLSIHAVLNILHRYFNPVYVIHLFPLGLIAPIFTDEEVRLREVK